MIRYEDELVSLHHRDALAGTWLEGDPIALVTDPPYGIGYRSRRAQRGEIVGDHSTDLRDAAIERFGRRWAIVFGTWKAKRPENVREVLVWSKTGPGMGDLSAPFGCSHEEIYLIGGPFLKVDPRSGSVLSYERIVGKVHPTPKPVDLMRRLIRTIPPEAVIVDPFAGSGSTLVAAKLEGRKAVGMEIDERYCAVAAERLREGVLL